MRRKLFTAVSMLSLLLFVATLALWLRSCIVHDRVSYRVGNEVWAVTDSRGGGILLGHRTAVELPIEPGFSYIRVKAGDWEVWFEGNDFLASTPVVSRGVDYFSRSVRNRLNAGVVVREAFGGTYFNGRNGPPIIMAADAWYTLVPFWVPALLFAVVGIWMAPRRIGRFSRLNPKCCLSCGYDLTGNTSGTCPECGTAIPKMPERKSPQPA